MFDASILPSVAIAKTEPLIAIEIVIDKIKSRQNEANAEAILNRVIIPKWAKGIFAIRLNKLPLKSDCLFSKKVNFEFNIFNVEKKEVREKIIKGNKMHKSIVM
ncbi:hypothetical protein IJR75_02460 [bacterium]|nr:hypothetical protein [bacterium]